MFFFFSSRRRHTRSVSAFLLNRSSDLIGRAVQQVSEIMRQMLTQAQTAGQYFTNDQIKEMKIGRASCRERVKIRMVAERIKKTKIQLNRSRTLQTIKETWT